MKEEDHPPDEHPPEAGSEAPSPQGPLAEEDPAQGTSANQASPLEPPPHRAFHKLTRRPGVITLRLEDVLRQLAVTRSSKEAFENVPTLTRKRRPSMRS